jgi:hypothetical protein
MARYLKKGWRIFSGSSAHEQYPSALHRVFVARDFQSLAYAAKDADAIVLRS